MSINPRHAEFARRVAVLGDATEAARQTRYSGNGIRVTAAKLMKKPEVQAIIAEERARLSQSQQITNDEIVTGLAEIANDRANPPAARVSAYRTLAEIRGMLRTADSGLPEGLTAMLNALANGLAQGAARNVAPTIEGSYREVRAS